MAGHGAARRSRWRAFVSAGATVVAAALLGACAATPPACTQTQWVYAGSDAGQVHALRLNTCTGRLSSTGAVAAVPKPRWMAPHAPGNVLYATSDSAPQGGRVMAFAVDPASGALRKLNETLTNDASTTQLWLDLPSRSLLAANFLGGTTSSLALQADGSMGALVSSVAGSGSGPHRRQNGPHAHGVAVDPTGRYVLTADLGADRLFVHGFDRASRVLSRDDDTSNPRAYAAAPGSGPRHFVFGADGRFVYLLNELSADIVVLRWNAQDGRLTAVQTLPISRPGFQGTKSASGIVRSADGRTLYVGERGEHRVVVYRVNTATGELSLAQRLPSGGETPWALALHQSGLWMLVANQRSNRVNLFSVDAASGLLHDSGQHADVPAPVSLAFF